MKTLYVAETRTNDGKTFLTLGLAREFQARLGEIGFIKPLGMADLRAGEMRLDEDAILIERACRVHANVQDMCPVTINREFTEEFYAAANPDDLLARVLDAYGRVSAGKQLVVAEGTGHAAMGGFLGLSNARVASALGARVLLVASGGIGQPIDDVLLNVAFYERFGVGMVGVVFNKVYPHEHEVLERVAGRLLEGKGVRFLGAIPYDPELSRPRVMDVLEATEGELLHGDDRLGETITRLHVGAMTAQRAMQFLRGGELIITPGDRGDMILAALTAARLGARPAALVLTGGVPPVEPVLRAIRAHDVPVMTVKANSFDTAKCVGDLRVRISPADTERVDRVARLVKEHVDMDAVQAALE
ncbi:MAG: AAA family ATPase [Planctomycetes bacterium]|nr:AAA family ATPase [Planctomycetota bacterium]